MSLLVWLLGCVPTPFDPCETSAACRDAFGLGWTCGDEGFCEEAAIHPRCARTWPDDLFVRPEEYSDRILLASLFDAETDVPEIQAARLPVMQVVDDGGLLERDFAILECTYETNSSLDTLDYPEAAAEVMTWLVEDMGVSAVIGPATSSQTQEAYLAGEAAGGAFIISPSATSPALTSLDGLNPSDEEPGLLWRTAPPDSLQGRAVAADMIGRGVKKVAVVYQTGPYGEGLAEVFLETFVQQGRTAETFVFSDSTARSDAVADVGAMGAQGLVEEIFFISSEVTDIVAFLNSAATIGGYDGMRFFLADGASDVQLLTETSGASSLWPRVRGSRPSVPQGLVYDAFRAAYAGAYTGQDATASIYTAYSFDAAWLAIYGIAWASLQEDSVTPEGVARGLRRVSSGTEVDIRATSWNDVKARFGNGQPIDVAGASGDLDYDPSTEETTAPIEIWAIDGGDQSFPTCYTFCWQGTNPVICGGADSCASEDSE